MNSKPNLKTSPSDSAKLPQQLILVVHWCLLIFVLSTAWFFAINMVAMAVMLAIYVVFLSLQSFKVFSEKGLLSVEWPFVVIEFLFVGATIYLTGGMMSPYMLLLVAYVVAMSLLYGYGGLALSCLLSCAAVLAMALPALHVSFAVIVLLAVALICGFAVASLTAGHKGQIVHQQPIKQAVSKEQNKLKILINSMTEAVFLLDRTGRVVLYNGAALELLDTHEDILGKPISSALPLEDGSKKSVDLAALYRKEQKLILRDDLIYRSRSHVVNIYATINPVVENGLSEGALILVRDISRQKTLAAQKDEFISIISHELRTPVAVVEADLSTLLVPNFVTLPDKALKLVRSAQSSLVFLQNLLQDLSDLSQADRSVLDIELNEIEPVEIINEIIKDLHSKAEETGVVLHSEVASNLPVVFSSKERLKEILVNFVTNAIKYSGQGKNVTLVARPSIKIQGGVQISIVDQGIGMSLSDQKRLFAKFFRAENAATQKVKGTGMGLYISKRQADRIGAKIWLQSKLGVGSTFFLEVPPKIPGEHKFTTELKT